MTLRRATAALLSVAALGAAAPVAAAEPWLCVPVDRRQVLHVNVREMRLCFLAS